MDFDEEYLLSDYDYSSDDYSEGENADSNVHHVNSAPMGFSNHIQSLSDLVIGEGTSSQKTEYSFEDSGNEFTAKAYQIIEGSISLDEYTRFIKKEKPVVGSLSISPEVTALVGQANMSYVKGNHSESFRLCKEAIRIEPRAAEPYRTLAELLEEGGDHIKALQLLIIAEDLSCRSCQVWLDLGDKVHDVGMLRPAYHCYTKAVYYDPTSLAAHQKRISIYGEIGGHRKNLTQILRRAITRLPPEHGEYILEQANVGASIMHESGDVRGALDLMEVAFDRCKPSVKFDHVNLIVELYMALQKYEQALEVIAVYCNVEISAVEQVLKVEGEEETSTVFRVESVDIFSDLPPQLRTKLAVILIHFEAFQLVNDVINPLISQVDEFGDLLLDVTEAYTSAGRHNDVVALLKNVLKSENMKQPQVWLQYGEALKAVGRKDEAVQALLEVMSIAPQLAEPRLMVSELLNDLGRRDEAITALSQDTTSHMDVGLLFERCLLLKDNPDRASEFMVAGRLLISRHCTCIRTQKEVTIMSKLSTWGRRAEALRKIQETTIADDAPSYVEGKRMPTPDDEWTIFKKMCDIAFKAGKFALLQRLVFSGMTSRVLCPTPEREAEMAIFAALSCYFNKDYKNTFTFLRNMIMQDSMDNSRIWTLFNAATLASEDLRHQKFIMRLIARKPHHPALPMLFANNCFICGSYKQAICEYLLQLKHNPSALICLLVSITFAQLACQKHSTSMNALVTQAQGFMAQYKDLRDAAASQEVEYNLGRMHHHLNILPSALYHYHKVFEIPALCPMLDLTKEAAYNIALIYQGTGSRELAYHYIQKYIVI